MTKKRKRSRKSPPGQESRKVQESGKIDAGEREDVVK
jgi:hypothetical protein